MKKRFVIYISIIAILTLVSIAGAESPWVDFEADFIGVEQIYNFELVPNEGDVSWPYWLVTKAITIGPTDDFPDFGAEFEFFDGQKIKAGFELDSIVHTPAIIGAEPDKGNVIPIFDQDGKLLFYITINLNGAIVNAKVRIYDLEGDGEFLCKVHGKGSSGKLNTIGAFGEWEKQKIHGNYEIKSFEFPPPFPFHTKLYGQWRSPKI